MNTVETIVNDLVSELSMQCAEMDYDTVSKMRSIFTDVVSRHVTDVPVKKTPVKKQPASPKKQKEEVVAVEKVKKPSFKTGYQLFVKERMSLPNDAKIGAKDRMKHIGESWKALTEEQQTVYKLEATQINESLKSPVVAEDVVEAEVEAEVEAVVEPVVEVVVVPVVEPVMVPVVEEIKKKRVVVKKTRATQA
jgi:hypothetical protein